MMHETSNTHGASSSADCSAAQLPTPDAVIAALWRCIGQILDAGGAAAPESIAAVPGMAATILDYQLRIQERSAQTRPAPKDPRTGTLMRINGVDCVMSASGSKGVLKDERKRKKQAGRHGGWFQRSRFWFQRSRKRRYIRR